MIKHYSIMRILLTVFMILSPLHTAQADDDHIEARRLLDSGEILPLETILQKARLILPGKVLEVELEKEDKLIVYELEILGDDGLLKEIYIDAKTGKQAFPKEDD